MFPKKKFFFDSSTSNIGFKKKSSKQLFLHDVGKSQAKSLVFSCHHLKVVILCSTENLTRKVWVKKKSTI